MSTAKKARLHFYNDLITANKTLFTQGSYIDRNSFATLFQISGIVNKGSYKKVQRSNLALVRVQQEINMLMRHNGLIIKSEDYYSGFRVTSLQKTKSNVVRYSGTVDTFDYYAAQLETTMAKRLKANTWGTYKRVPKKAIDALSTTATTNRQKAVAQRVAKY